MDRLKEEALQNNEEYINFGSSLEIPNIVTIFMNSGSNTYYINYDTSKNRLLFLKDYLEMSGMTLDEFNSNQIDKDVFNV